MILICDPQTRYLPFFLYCRCISAHLTENGIENRVIGSRDFADQEAGSDDVVLVFLPFLKLIRQHIGTGPGQAKLIIINSELLCLNTWLGKLRDVASSRVFVWDYCNANMGMLSDTPIHRHIVSPFTYHPYLETHFRETSDEGVVDKDIDFMLVGWDTSPRRKCIIEQLSGKYNFLTVNGARHMELYNSLKRAKIVILVRFYEENDSLDFYRLCYLLSNKFFFIHEETSEPLARDFDKLIYSPYSSFVETCEEWIGKSQEERDQKAAGLYEWWKEKHPIGKYIPLQEIASFCEAESNEEGESNCQARSPRSV